MHVAASVNTQKNHPLNVVHTHTHTVQPYENMTTTSTRCHLILSHIWETLPGLPIYSSDQNSNINSWKTTGKATYQQESNHDHQVVMWPQSRDPGTTVLQKKETARKRFLPVIFVEFDSWRSLAGVRRWNTLSGKWSFFDITSSKTISLEKIHQTWF